MSSPFVVNTLGSIPIPVGHKVRVTYFAKAKSGGFFGKSDSPGKVLDAPLIEDLHTGVVYGASEHFECRLMRDGSVNLEHHDIDSSLVTHKVVEGTVRSSRVVFVGLQTTSYESRLELDV